MFRMSRREAIFDGLFTKEDIVDGFHVDDEDSIEEEVYGATVMEIYDLRNEYMRETEDDLNMILLLNYKEVNKAFSRKNKSPVWAFFLPFRKVACNDGAIWYYCKLYNFFEPRTQQETMKGVIKYTKNTSSIRNHVLHGHANKFTSFLSFLELRKTSQLDNSSELSADAGSRKWRKDNKVSVGGRFSDYLLPCHPYVDNNPNQRESEGNIVALMAHTFTLLLLVDHDCFHNMKQDIDPRLHPVGR